MAEKGGPPPTPKWIVTFTDLMSLLLTFFILLLTFSTPRKEKLYELRGSIKGTFGIFADAKDDRDTFISPSERRIGRDQRNPFAPAQPPRFRPLEVHEPNAVLMKLKDQSGDELLVDAIDEGYRIRIKDTIVYDSAAELMHSSGYDHLDKIAKAIEFMPYHLVVVGFVGGAEERLVRERGMNPMDLAIRRAVHLAERLMQRHRVPGEIIGVAGYGPPSGDQGPGRAEFLLIDRERFRRGN
jgi:chemotaxis protein MotB